MPGKNDSEALREYLAAHEAYNKRLGEWVVHKGNIPGRTLDEAIVELNTMAGDLEKKRQAWMRLIRKK